MPQPRIIATANELDRIAGKLNEAVDKSPMGLEDFTDLEKAQFQAQLPRAIAAIRGNTKSPNVLTTAQNQFASLLQSKLAADAQTPDGGSTIALTADALEAKFDTGDWFGWAKTAWHMPKDARNKFPWQDPPAAAETIPQFGESPVMALFSDWGTGMYGAPVIAASIQREQNVNIVLHLGDVYYSGTEDEFRDRFSATWPRYPGAIHRTLNGNHEMYSGGRPYWKVIQQPPFNQTSSCFAYQNDNWLVIALDTAYSEHDLFQDPPNGHDEVAWLNKLVDDAGERSIVLFSHHQPFSLLDQQGPKLVAKMKAHLFDTKKVFAWYWGHEHECVVYDKHPDWGFYGRCVGNAGMPEARKLTTPPVASPRFVRIEGRPKHPNDITSVTIPSALVLDGRNEYITGEQDKFIPHGYVRLEFKPDRIVETYLNPDGSQLMAPIELHR